MPGRRPGDDLVLVHAGRQFQQDMQPGGDPGDPGLRDVAPDRRDEMVPAPPVGQPGAAHLPVVGPGGEELGQRELVQAAGVPVGEGLGRGDLVHEVGGDDEPAQPQAGREAFAGRPGVDDPLRPERLHGPDRLAVVAELPVVVVLDEEPAGPRGPFDGPGPPAGCEHAAQRELVGRGQQRGVRVTEPA